MTTAEQERWSQLRERAAAFLPRDFAAHIVRQAQRRQTSNRRQYWVIAITAGLGLAAIMLGDWYLGNQMQNRNLALWSLAEAQIRALRTAI